MTFLQQTFHYVNLFIQWSLIALALFLLIGGNGLQDYVAGVAFILVAIFLRLRMLGLWATRTMVVPPTYYRSLETPPSAKNGDWWYNPKDATNRLMQNGVWVVP